MRRNRDEATIKQVADRIRMVPGTWRRFTLDAADVTRVHRIPPDLLERLLDHGLPSAGTGPSRRFDALDVENVELGLGLGPRWRTMRWWSESLAGHDTGAGSAYRIAAPVECPAPGHPGACASELDPVLTAALQTHRLENRGAAGFAFDVDKGTDPAHRFGPEYADLVRAATALRFHVLPREITGDCGFAAETGLADCKLATAFLSRSGGERGLGVRPARGLFVGVPFPVWHAWLWLAEGGRWRAADPFLLGAFARWGIVDAGRWPPSRSIEGLVVDLDPAHFRVVGHAAQPVLMRLRAVNETVLGISRPV